MKNYNPRHVKVVRQLSKSYLVKSYVVNELPISDIIYETGLSRKVIRNQLKMLGIMIRGVPEAYRTKSYRNRVGTATKGKLLGRALTHKVFCGCCVCNAKRGIFNHRVNCECFICQVKRGEYYDKHPGVIKKRNKSIKAAHIRKPGSWVDKLGHIKQAKSLKEHYLKYPQSSITKIKRGLTNKQHYKLHSERGRNQGAKLSLAYKKNPELGENIRKRMRDPLVQLKMAHANATLKPNNVERKLFNLCAEVAPGIFLLNTKAEVGCIGTMRPDLLSLDKMKAIEHFGIWWHYGLPKRKDSSWTKEKAEEKRVAKLKTYGVDCLVVWEDELKRYPEFVKAKIKNFIGDSYGSSNLLLCNKAL